MWLSVGDAQDLLATEGEKVSAELAKREGTLDGVKEEMGQLKATLYARFGRSINLEA